EGVRRAGPERLACDQVLYHPEQRAIEHRVLPTCEQHQLALVGYSPFRHGRFPSSESPGGRVLAEIAQRYEVTPRAVVLAFLTRHPGTFAIPKAARPEHAVDNATAG